MIRRSVSAQHQPHPHLIQTRNQELRKQRFRKGNQKKKDRGLLGKISDNYVVADLFVSLVLNMSSTLLMYAKVNFE